MIKISIEFDELMIPYNTHRYTIIVNKQDEFYWLNGYYFEGDIGIGDEVLDEADETYRFFEVFNKEEMMIMREEMKKQTDYDLKHNFIGGEGDE